MKSTYNFDNSGNLFWAQLSKSIKCPIDISVYSNSSWGGFWSLDVIKFNLWLMMDSTPVNLWELYDYARKTQGLSPELKSLIKTNVHVTSLQNLLNIFVDPKTETMQVFEYLKLIPTYFDYSIIDVANFYNSTVLNIFNFNQSWFPNSIESNLLFKLSYEYARNVNYFNNSYRIFRQIETLTPRSTVTRPLEDLFIWTDIYNRYDISEIQGPRNVPDCKIYYPEPFIASPSFHHEDLWFIHILHYQYWLWFFFISIIIFFFIAFINVVKWCNMRTRPRRETRGVSRSKCADLITASIPVLWASSIIVAENVDAVDYYDGFGTGEMVVGIRAYQWGWEYFYPKTIDLQYNMTPSYSQLMGNSLKYSNTTTQTINLNKFWKFYQQKSANMTTNTPSNLLLNPTSKFNILNVPHFDRLGLELGSDAAFTRQINYYTRNNSQYLYNSVTDYALKYKKINNLYLNEDSTYNTLNYGSLRQHQYSNLKSNLNRNQNFFEKKSLNKFLNYTTNIQTSNSFEFKPTNHKFLAPYSNSFTDAFKDLTYDYSSNTPKTKGGALISKSTQNKIYPYLSWSGENLHRNLKLINSLIVFNKNLSDEKVIEDLPKFQLEALKNLKYEQGTFLTNKPTNNYFETYQKVKFPHREYYETSAFNTMHSINSKFPTLTHRSNLIFNTNTIKNNTLGLEGYYNLNKKNSVKSFPNRVRYGNIYGLYVNSRYELVENLLWDGSYPRENIVNFFYPESCQDFKVVNTEWHLLELLKVYTEYRPAILHTYINELDGMYQDAMYRAVAKLPMPPRKSYEVLGIYKAKYPVSPKPYATNKLWLEINRNSDWKKDLITSTPLETEELTSASLGVDDTNQGQPTNFLDTKNTAGLSLSAAYDDISLIFKPFITISSTIESNPFSKELLTKMTSVFTVTGFIPSDLLTYTNYSNFVNENLVNETSENYSLYKNINYFYSLNYKNILNVDTSLYNATSYINLFNNFKMYITDDQTTLNTTNFDNNDYVDYVKSTGNNLKLDSEVQFLDSTKFYIKKLKAMHKVYKTKFEEGRSLYHLQDMSNSYIKYPFFSDAKFKYTNLLAKNSNPYFLTNLYNTKMVSNFNELFFTSNALNSYISEIPFLVSIRTDATRYLWFDWYSKWSSVDIVASKPGKYNLTGFRHVPKGTLHEDSELNGLIKYSESYLLQIAKGRKNYTSNWAATPYFYEKITNWYKFYYSNLRLFGKSDLHQTYWRRAYAHMDFLELLTSPNPDKKKLKLIKNYYLSAKTTFTPTYSEINSPRASYYKNFNKYTFSTSTLIDILSKREFLYRQYFNNINTIKYIPTQVILTPKNPLIGVVKAAFNLENPTVYSTEISREFFYSKQSYLKFLLLKGLVNWNYEALSNLPINLSKVINYLYLQANNEYDWSNKRYNSSTSLKNPFKPMRKGITNMLKLHTSGAIAMPIEIRLHLVASSKDIIHSWAIPSAGIKVDCLPGFSAHRVILFLSTGIFWGQCMEVCGRYHHWMPIVVYFMKRDLFFLWCTHFIHYSQLDDFFTTTDRQLINRTYYRNLKTNVWADEVIKIS